MSEPRFRVTSCTGYPITPGTEPGSHGKVSWQGAPSCWQVLDSGHLYNLMGEWRPKGRSGPKECERTARRFAAALNEWDEKTRRGETCEAPQAPPTTKLSAAEYVARAKARR